MSLSEKLFGKDISELAENEMNQLRKEVFKGIAEEKEKEHKEFLERNRVNPIKRLRLELGYETQESFARKIDMPITTFQKLEKKTEGFENIKVETLYKVSHGFNLKPEALMHLLSCYEMAQHELKDKVKSQEGHTNLFNH